MSALALDVYGDFDLSATGRLYLLTGPQETAQRLQQKFQLVQGEWFLDTRIGVPLFLRVLIKNPDVAAITRMYLRIVTDDPAVSSIIASSSSYSPTTRNYALTFQAQHNSGAVITGGAGVPFYVQEAAL